MESYEIATDSGGYISIRPSYAFDFYHHHFLSFDKRQGFFGLNLSPLKEGNVRKIEDLNLTDKGYEFLCLGRKYYGEDKTDLERQLSKYLIETVPLFSFKKASQTNLSIEYSPDLLLSLRMTTYLEGQEASFFKLIRAKDGLLYSGDFPLSDTEAILADEVELEADKIIVNKGSSTEIQYYIYIQEDIKDLLAIFLDYL